MKKFVCCVLALGILFLGGCGSKSKKVEETAVICPYTIQTQRDGSLRLKLDAAQLPGYDWQYDMRWKDVCRIDIDEKENNAVLTLTGLKEGLEEITVRCVKEGDPPDHRFVLSLQVDVNEANEVMLHSYNGRTLTGSGSAGENTGAPYRWNTDESGVVTLTVECEDSTAWSLISEDNAAFMLGDLLYAPGELMLEIVPQSEGEGTVLLEHDESGQMTVGITVGSDLALTVTVEGAPDAEAADNG